MNLSRTISILVSYSLCCFYRLLFGFCVAGLSNPACDTFPGYVPLHVLPHHIEEAPYDEADLLVFAIVDGVGAQEPGMGGCDQVMGALGW